MAGTHTSDILCNVPNLVSSVSNLIQEASEICVMPIFGKREAYPEEKSPGEWVTEADKACELFLEPALKGLLPNSIFVGEEAVHGDPSILSGLSDEGEFWLVDPLDGTSNFANGIAPFALMVALIRSGETVASWIFNPMDRLMSIAERGSGSWINGERVKATNDYRGLDQLKGAALRRFLPPEIDQHIAENEKRFASLSGGSKCSGYDYPALANGSLDFVLYWRTLPWDHAPGILILQEAGGYVSRLDGSPYRPADYESKGLLATQSADMWREIKTTLLPK